jgi:hypothetical protein
MITRTGSAPYYSGESPISCMTGTPAKPNNRLVGKVDQHIAKQHPGHWPGTMGVGIGSLPGIVAMGNQAT